MLLEQRRVKGVVSLLRKYGCYPLAPSLLDRVENGDFVVDQHVTSCRIDAFDRRQLLLFVNINQDVVVELLPEPGTIDLSRLKDRVSIRENDCAPELAHMSNGLERAGIKKIGEWIVQNPSSQAQCRSVMRSVQSVALYGSEIVGVAEFAPQFLEMPPISVARLIAVGGAQVRAKFALKPVIVEQSVVDVEKEDDIIIHMKRPTPRRSHKRGPAGR